MRSLNIYESVLHEHLRLFSPKGYVCFLHQHKIYIHIFINFLSYFVEILSRNAGNSFSQFFCVHSSLVIHEIVSDGLGDVILALMVEDLVVDLSFGSLELFIGYEMGVFWVGGGVQA